MSSKKIGKEKAVIFLMGINVIIYYIYIYNIKFYFYIYIYIYIYILLIPENRMAFSKQGMPFTTSWSTALAIVHFDKAATSGMVERMCRNH